MVTPAHPWPAQFACDLASLWNPWRQAFDETLDGGYKVAAEAAGVRHGEPVNASQARIACCLQMVNVQFLKASENLNRSGRKVLKVLQIHSETHPAFRRCWLLSCSSAIRRPNHQPPTLLEQTDGAGEQSEGFDRVFNQIAHHDHVRRIEIPRSLRKFASHNRDVECPLQKIAGFR